MAVSTSPNRSPVQEFARIASSELEALTAFTAVLDQERDALYQSNEDALPGITSAKILLAQTLTRCAEERVRLLNAAGVAITSPEVRRFLAASPDTLELWERVLSVARQASELNAGNGYVVQQRLVHVNQALALLAGSQASLYDTSGGARHGIKASRSLGSV